MLMPLNEIAQTLQIDESEALNFVVYCGVGRRNGLYDEREFLLAQIRYLREKVFGVAGRRKSADSESRRRKRHRERDSCGIGGRIHHGRVPRCRDRFPPGTSLHNFRSLGPKFFEFRPVVVRVPVANNICQILGIGGDWRIGCKNC
jgi:hypothetical protein